MNLKWTKRAHKWALHAYGRPTGQKSEWATARPGPISSAAYDNK